MRYLLGMKEILHTQVLLSAPYLAQSSQPGASLSDAYRRFLASLALCEPYREYMLNRLKDSGDAGGSPQVVSTMDTAALVLSAFNRPPQTDLGAGARPWQIKMLNDAWACIHTSDSELSAIARLLVHTVVVTNSDWRGSMSDRDAIGTIWLVPSSHWHSNEVVEALIHEITHSCLFLDERRYGHFRAGADRIQLRSAIRRDPRELPAVVHSLLVAVELLAWREAQEL